ncbi:unnamed protein product [Orchesella dallaii]|uniref:C2H2-type domain-containing protein n=1 Tax=Orchesella dallaii TaxID=48710 RepID=A0ABP1RQN2_9HEXA
MNKRRRSRKAASKSTSETKLVHCLFCAAPCPPTFSIINGQLTRLEHDVPPAPDGKGSSGRGRSTLTPVPTLTFLEEEECSSLAAQLKVVFILKNILEIGEEKFHKFLGVLEGQLHPEFWVQTCGYCGEAVRVCYETVKEISRLEKKFKSIKEELKGRIVETKEETGRGLEEVVGSVWNEIRQEILDEEGDQSKPEDVDDDQNQEFRKFPNSPSNSEVIDEEDDEAIDEFLNGNPPQPSDEAPSNMGLPSSHKESSLREMGLSSQKRRLNFESDEVNQQVKFPRQSPADNYDDSNSATDTPHEEDSPIYINGNIFEDENDDDDDEEDFQLDFEMEQSETALKMRESTNKDEERKGRKQKLVPTIASPDIYLIPPPVIKEEPKFTTFPKDQRTHYQCMQCPAIYIDKKAATEHLNLHRPHSSSITCPTPNCCWVLDPQKVTQHNNSRHRTSTGIGGIHVKQCTTWKYYRCAECDALFGALKRLRIHWELHDKGDGEVCNECGWLCVNVSCHKTIWHSKEGGKHEQTRLRSAHRQIVTVERDHQNVTWKKKM